MIAAPILDSDRPDLPARCYLERAIVANLIAHLQSRGFDPYKASDGEERHKVSTIKEAMEVIFSVDQAWLYVRKAGVEKGHTIMLVLGNGEDCIADHSVGDGFDKAMDEFCDDVLPSIVSGEGLHKALAEAQAEIERLAAKLKNAREVIGDLCKYAKTTNEAQTAVSAARLTYRDSFTTEEQARVLQWLRENAGKAFHWEGRDPASFTFLEALGTFGNLIAREALGR